MVYLSSGVRIAVYDALRKKFGTMENNGLALWEAAVCGVTAGGLAQWYVKLLWFG